MKTRHSDDIGVLCAHAGIRRETYRVFSGPPRLNSAAETVAPLARPHEGRVQELPRRTALHAALETALLNSRTAAAPGVSVPSLELISCGGGAGVTTLLASMARLFSSWGERVAVVDRAGSSSVPLYFGASALSGGRCTFLVPHKTSVIPIHLIAGEETPDPLSQLDGEVDRILVDAACVGGEARGLRLLVVTPDVGAILRASNLAPGESCRVLLNKFAAGLPLHEEIRRTLAAQFGPRFLPFCIRRSDDFDEALAQGVTVHEYSPGGTAAEDVLRLATWLRKEATA